jgi:hypothetical protein
MISRRDFLKLTAASGASLLVELPFGGQPFGATIPSKLAALPRINLVVPDQIVEVRNDQDQPLFQARFEVDGRSNKNGQASGSFNMQYLSLQEKMQNELKFEFMEALILETGLPAGAVFRGSGWSLRGRERHKTEFTATFTRSTDDPNYLNIEFAGAGIFDDASGPPKQVDWRSKATGTITFKD